MTAPGPPRAPTQTLPGCRKAQGQGEQAAWEQPQLIDPQPQARQHQGDDRLVGSPSTKGTGMASSCPGMGQQQQPPHAPVPQGGWHPSLVGDTIPMLCALEEEGVAM